MMRIITILFFVVSLFSFQDNKIAERAKKIRAKLLYSKTLPPMLTKPDSFSEHKVNESFLYNIDRNDNNSVDSIFMIVTAFLDDSLNHIISFYEVHLRDNKTFMYQINTSGIIDWAYKSDDPNTMKLQDLEINTDSAIYLNDSVHTPIKNPDEKTRAFYEGKLMTSLDELEKILFSK